MNSNVLPSLFMPRAAFAALAIALACASPAQAQDKPTVSVLTYSSFAGKYGPGPALKTMFEADCGCVLKFVALEDAGALLARLKLDGDASEIDAVVGLDQNQIGEAGASGLFAPHERDAAMKGFSLPVPWSDATFLPFDYGWFAFVYDKGRLSAPPVSLKDLVETARPIKILIQDPRSSTVGLGGLVWMKAAYGDQAGEAWGRLKSKIVTVTKGWSQAYGMFMKREADMVLSYTSSPAYHRVAESNDAIEAAIFAEGHPLQVETAAVTASSKRKDLARAFLTTLVSAAGQSLLPATQWMYPVNPQAVLPPAFAALPKPKTIAFDPAAAERGRRAWIEEWLGAMAR